MVNQEVKNVKFHKGTKQPTHCHCSTNNRVQKWTFMRKPMKTRDETRNKSLLPLHMDKSSKCTSAFKCSLKKIFTPKCTQTQNERRTRTNT